jgi:lipopolysaccharide export system permease protein
MKRLDRLIFLAVAPAILLVWAVLVGIDTLSGLLNELDEVGIGDYDIGRVVQYIVLTVPRRAYNLFSTAAIVGVLMGLGALAASSELTALQAAGASRARIARSAVQAAAILLAGALLLGEYLGPRTDRMAADLVAQAKAKGIAFSGSGLWLRDGRAVWNARRIVITGPGQVELWEVSRYAFDDEARLVDVIKGERASYRGDRFEITGLSRDLLGDAGIESATLERIELPTLLDPGLIEAHTVRPRQQATADLWQTIRYARVNQLDALAFESAFWYRVFYPLICLALAFAAVPFAFGQQRSGGAARRLMLGMVIGISFFFAHRTLINLAEAQRQGLVLVNLLPPLLLVLASAWWLRRPAS